MAHEHPMVPPRRPDSLGSAPRDTEPPAAPPPPVPPAPAVPPTPRPRRVGHAPQQPGAAVAMAVTARTHKKSSSYDEGSLDQYLRDISIYPLIDRAEEVRLAQRIRDGDGEAL